MDEQEEYLIHKVRFAMSVNLEKYTTFFIIFFFLFSSIISYQMKVIGIGMTGFEYVFYIIMLLPFLYLIKGITFFKDYLLVSLIFTLFSIIPIFFSKYIISLLWFIVGITLYLIPVLTFIILYNVSLSLNKIIKIFRGLEIIIFFVAITFVIRTIINFGSVPLTHLILAKDLGIAATMFNCNIIVSLFLFRQTQSKRHLLIIFISLLSIILSLALKSIVSVLITFIFYFYFFNKRSKVKFILTVLVFIIGFSLVILLNSGTRNKIDLYLYYYFTSYINNVGRGASYISAFNIANDFFPIGTGPSTYGSYPVKLLYNDVYYDYGLNNIWGMHNPKSDNIGPSFLLDQYWSSPLAEVGFIGFLCYLALFFYPIKKIFKYENKIADEIISFKFYIITMGVVIFVQSIVLSVYSQISFVLLYTGMSSLMIRYIKTKLSE